VGNKQYIMGVAQTSTKRAGWCRCIKNIINVKHIENRDCNLTREELHLSFSMLICGDCREGKPMICNRCIKQDVCKYKDRAEEAEETIKHNYPYMEIDCKHRECATDEQMRRFFNNTQ
jgi:hypothetical protein